MFAAIDSLVPLLIFIVIAVISAILKKKTTDADEQHSDLPRMPRGPEEPPRTRRNWEEELRELLQKQLPQQQPAPPPLPQHQVPPPILRPDYRQVPGPRPAPAPTPIEHKSLDKRPQHDKSLHGFWESDQRHAHAAALDEGVTQHMQELRNIRVGLTTAERHDFRSSHQAIAMVRDPRNLRAAILATVVLGPPKALEQV